MTPLFARLDNAIKEVPILDRQTRRVRFVDAPKEYRFPVRIAFTDEKQSLAERLAWLVISKRGVVRVESRDY
jgi:hypothetical protein